MQHRIPNEPTNALVDLERATAEHARCTQEAEARWHTAIHRAAEEKHRKDAVAAAAGIPLERLYQIITDQPRLVSTAQGRVVPTAAKAPGRADDQTDVASASTRGRAATQDTRA